MLRLQFNDRSNYTIISDVTAKINVVDVRVYDKVNISRKGTCILALTIMFSWIRYV